MAVVRNIQNDDLYLYLGDNRFRNMRTGGEGVVPDEAAQKIFKINVEATALWTEYPILESLIKSLNLKIDKK